MHELDTPSPGWTLQRPLLSSQSCIWWRTCWGLRTGLQKAGGLGSLPTSSLPRFANTEGGGLVTHSKAPSLLPKMRELRN